MARIAKLLEQFGLTKGQVLSALRVVQKKETPKGEFLLSLAPLDKLLKKLNVPRTKNSKEYVLFLKILKELFNSGKITGDGDSLGVEKISVKSTAKQGLALLTKSRPRFKQTI